jgi:hypothetical protein
MSKSYFDWYAHMGMMDKAVEGLKSDIVWCYDKGEIVEPGGVAKRCEELIIIVTLMMLEAKRTA